MNRCKQFILIALLSVVYVQAFAYVGFCFDAPQPGYTRVVGATSASPSYCADPGQSGSPTPPLPGTPVNSFGVADSNGSYPLPVGSGANAYPQGSAPNGWSDPNTPPSATSLQTGYCYSSSSFPNNNNCSPTYSTQQLACDALAKAINSSYYGTYSSQCTIYTGSGAAYSTASINTARPCPQGYTQSGTSCSLSNAAYALWPSDGKCTVARVGNTFANNPRDPDCSGGNPYQLPSGTSTSSKSSDGSSITSTGIDGSTVTVKINTDGTSTATYSKPDPNGTVTDSTTINISAAGGGGTQGTGGATGTAIVTGTNTGTTPGTGNLAGTGTGTSPSLDTSSLAKDSTLQAVKTNTDSINNALTKTTITTHSATELYAPYNRTMSQALNDFVTHMESKPIYASSVGFFSANPTGSCPTWEIPAVMGMTAIPITAQCSQTMNQVWPWIQAIIIAAASFLAFRWAFL